MSMNEKADAIYFAAVDAHVWAYTAAKDLPAEERLAAYQEADRVWDIQCERSRKVRRGEVTG